MAIGKLMKALTPLPGPDRAIAWIVLATALFGALTLSFYPTFSWPHGDEATYISYARNPWTNISPFFEGFRPKEVQNPYNFRLFLAPISAALAVFGGFVPARAVQLVWGLVLLVLGYRVGRRLGARRHAVAVMGVLSLSPYFVFFTHGIRPEGLFAMWTMLVTCVLLGGEEVSPRRWAAVAFLSSAAIWIHYNGVVMPLVFLVGLLVRDFRALTPRKLGAFLWGGVAFLVLYLPLNIFPALDTIREFGVLPVTFASTNRIPAMHDGLAGHVLHALDFYRGFFTGGAAWWIDPLRTGWFAYLVLPFAALSLFRRGAHLERVVGSLWLATFAVLVLLVPNLRPEYAYYLMPWTFVLAGRGLSLIPGLAGRVVSTLVLGVVAALFLHALVVDVGRFLDYAPDNRTTARALREIVAETGLERPRILGGQEFRAIVPEAEFRTHHSMIVTRSVARTVALTDPDIIIQHTRTVMLIADHLRAERRPGELPISFILRSNDEFMDLLGRGGYVRARDGLHWDDQDVVIWMRSPQPPVPAR